PLDREKAKRNIETFLEKMHKDTDVSLLSEYHKIYKKEISFFKRSWAAAWLFMYYDQKEVPSIKPVPPKPANIKKSSVEEKTSALSDIALPEDVSKKLFISIGKNRRLYPREIITLIMSKTEVPREDIGVIRILDNYSFVQVRDIKADEIIKALNGIRFRGRTLTVNYAKPKTNEE
ncbi:MAG: DbpA RNA binding domain-containing protein, partial [Treponema sp.]|nr:DbpA RNA binding domain-containing protein [Treponema sp.]